MKKILQLLFLIITFLGIGSDAFAGSSAVYSKYNQIRVINKLHSMGYSKLETAAIAGNIWRESQFDPTAYRVTDTEDSYGLFQWNNNRKDMFMAWTKKHNKNYATIETQLEYFSIEFKGRTRYLFTKAQTIVEKTVIFCRLYERPAGTRYKKIKRADGTTGRIVDLNAKYNKEEYKRIRHAVSILRQAI